MKLIIPLTLLCSASIASAVVIGIETFDIDGPLDGQSGGTGFDYDTANDFDPFTGGSTGTPSDWEGSSVASTVSGGVLSTFNSNGIREYNGPGEGVPPSDEGDGAVRGTGVVFFRVDITRHADAAWSGLSSFDFGNERVFFGVPGAGGATDTIGIEESGAASRWGPSP